MSDSDNLEVRQKLNLGRPEALKLLPGDVDFLKDSNTLPETVLSCLWLAVRGNNKPIVNTITDNPVLLAKLLSAPSSGDVLGVAICDAADKVDDLEIFEKLHKTTRIWDAIPSERLCISLLFYENQKCSEIVLKDDAAIAKIAAGSPCVLLERLIMRRSSEAGFVREIISKPAVQELLADAQKPDHKFPDIKSGWFVFNYMPETEARESLAEMAKELMNKDVSAGTQSKPAEAEAEAKADKPRRDDNKVERI